MRLLNAARDPATILFVTSQILAEFYSIVTSPWRVAVPRSPGDALRALSALLAFWGVHVLPAANNVDRIYTFNTEDFGTFSELAVLTPSC